MIGAVVGEYVREPAMHGQSLLHGFEGGESVSLLGNHGGTEADGEACGEDEAVTAREVHGAYDANTRDSDCREKEGSHATEDGARDGDKRSSKLGEDAHDDEPEAARVTGLAVRAARQCNDTIVLRKSRHRCDGAEGGDDTV